MQHVIRNLLLVLALLVVFGLRLTPPEKQIRLGKDLRGGVTLTYQVQLERGDDPNAVIPQMIEVLKQRVDPNGLFEISMVQQGRDRIQISMPAPSEEIKQLRDAYEAELSRLAELAVSEQSIDALLRAEPGEERQRHIERIAGGDESRRQMLETLVPRYEEAVTLRAEARRAENDPDASPERIDELAEAAAEANIAYERARRALVQSAPSEEEVRRALRKSNRRPTVYDEDKGERVSFPSPRERAIEALKERYPGAVDEIERVVEAHDEYLANRTTLDDPTDLIELLQASGVLSFRITVDARGDEALPPGQVQSLRERLRELGPDQAGSDQARWFKINRIESWYDDVSGMERLLADPAAYFDNYGDTGYVVEEYQGDYWMLSYDVPGARLTQETQEREGEWSVSRASRGQDRTGRPAINFRMDANGARLLGRLTSAHEGDNMAILLDDEVYTAPNLITTISRNGQITGSFTNEEIDYIIRVLNAGSLQARLSDEPISQSTVGPELGKDNLEAGMRAGIIALIAVSAFMVFYYFRFGAIAVISLFCNAILILGALAFQRAALTLPGIAGIILTFGMAVDANVLIYERIREELRKGQDFKASVRLGYQKALSSIVDGNVTNLIVAVVLALPGVSTQEVKGFAITLGIGVIATLFSALVVSRLIVAFLMQYGGWHRALMLPTVVPVIERALEPRIAWLKLRWVFIVISVSVVGLGLTMIARQGSVMLDTEFVGGTQVELRFKKDESGRAIERPRQVVEDGLESVRQAALGDEESANDVLADLASATVVALEPREDEQGRVVSDRYLIKTRVEDARLLQRHLQREFRGLLDVEPPIDFVGADDPVGRTYPVVADKLIDNVVQDQSFSRFRAPERNVAEYRDGVVLVLEDLRPRPTLDALREKLKHTRTVESQYEDIQDRTWMVAVLEGGPDQVITAAVVVRDPGLTLAQPEVWERRLAQQEWQLVSDALGQETSLASVQKFSSSVAETFRARAVAAVVLSFVLITIYIWVRFGSVRYSMAAITCLMHDVLTCVGLIALAEIVYDHPATQGIAQSLGIMPFKIDLNMIAAILTIIGYSLNDTIIVMDRIRENRGRLPYASAEVIETSINQTISRTVITSGTTLLAVLILYFYGGEGVRAFSYALIIGVAVGTYSSIAVAAPLVWSGRREGPGRVRPSPGEMPDEPADAEGPPPLPA